MPIYPDLYVLRHGETHWNAEGRMQGWLNSPLTDRGIAQARHQGDILSACNLDDFAFYSSPLGRAFQTAGLALGHHATLIHTDDRLREIDVGVWQGRLRADLASGVLCEGPDGDIGLYDRAPGEGLDGLRYRARAFLDDLDGPAVLVCHGIISRILRQIVLGLDHNGMINLPGGQGNVFYLKNDTQEELR